MKKIAILFGLFISHGVLANPLSSSLWRDIQVSSDNNSPRLKALLDQTAKQPLKRRTLTLNEQKLRELLTSKVTPFSGQKKKAISSFQQSNYQAEINLPLPDGKFVLLKVYDSPILSPEIAEQYPDIKTWRVQGVDNPGITGRLDFTSKGFHGMLSMPDGDIIYIDPDKNSGSDLYFSLSKSENLSHFKTEFDCQVHDKHSLISQFKNKDLAGKKLAQAPAPDLITYRLAIAGTAEYTDSQGGTPSSAYASMITTINRVNEIYQRDLGVKLEIVSGNNLAYTNASTDPYTNSNASAMIGENINNLNNTFGASNYDIGHVFAQGRLGGLAYVGATCYDNFKAGGTTGIVDPQGEVFAIEFVAHEMGHQLGATHTFNSEKGGCGNGNRSAESAVEPGSGSTIMSYSGLCETDDIQYNSDAMFHWVSISQINHYTRVEEGRSCGSRSSTGNQNPVADAGADSIIPLNTPFLLKGSATGGATYAWDQIDAGSASPVDTDTADNAIIRSLLPSSNQDRYIPRLSDLFSGSKTIGEYLPQTVRELNFTFVVRDNNGGIDSDLKSISVKDSGGIFKVLSQSSDEVFTTGETVDIAWTTGNTNNAPISCNKVDIQLIRENGIKNMLLANTDNDGAQQLVVADNIPVMTDARVMVNCSNQPFFQISSGNITVQKGVNASDTTPPIIQIIGSSSITIEQNTSYSDAGATAQDNKDGEVTVTTSGSVNTSVVGTYRITYTATDAAGNTATAVRVVNVVPITDTTPPIIQIIGSSSITIEQNTNYSDAGATAQDNKDGEVTVTTSGSVNTSVVGTYRITYTATDAAGNTATAVRVVNVVSSTDTTPPVIHINGSSTISIVKGTSYSDAGATAQDDTDGTVSVSTTGSVDTSVVGTYRITYTATDAAGNTATAIRIVQVTSIADNTPPVITIIGETYIEIIRGTDYIDAGATATDNVDVIVSVSKTGAVNTGVVGTYSIVYTATDSAGNTSRKTRTVKVIPENNVTDTTAPVIFLQGNTVITLHIGQTYHEPGFSAVDDIDGVVSVIVGGVVDTSTAGTYILRYTASDNTGNVVTVTRTVNVVATPVVDSIAPVITLQGSSTITLTEGDSYNEPGFSAHDNIDGNISVIISGSVNTNVPGTYILTYTATDAAGNSSTRSRTITVQKKNNGTKGEDSSKGGGMGILLLPLALIGLRRRINKETKG